MTTRTQLAYAAAGIVLVLGLLSLLNPVLASRLLGLEIAAARGLSEVRATYGSLHVTMAALLLWALPLRPRAAGMVRVMGLLWLGAAAGRVASLAIDPVVGFANVALLLVQLLVGGALVWTSFETPPTGPEARARRDAAAARRRLDAARARAAKGAAKGSAKGAATGATLAPPADAGAQAPAASPGDGGRERA